MSLQQFAAKDLVAGGDIVNREAGEQIADDGKEPVEQVAVVAGNAMRAAVEAVAEDGVGVTFEDGLQKLGIVAGIVFQVGVLDEDHFAGGLREAGADACALAHVLLVQRELDGVRAVVAQLSLQVGLLQEFAGAVGGEVIDDDEFLVQSDRLIGHLLEQLHHGLPLVKDRNDDGERAELRVRLRRQSAWRGRVGIFRLGASWTDLREQIDREHQQHRINRMPIARMRETHIVNQADRRSCRLAKRKTP